MFTRVLDLENRDDHVWADSGYTAEKFEESLVWSGDECRIHKREARNDSLSEKVS
jgi:hypothetical protein